MGLTFHDKTYYSSSAQFIALSESTSPIATANDFNCDYLLNQRGIISWAQNYLTAGKFKFSQYNSYIKKLTESERSYAGLDNTIVVDPDHSYEVDDTLKSKLFTNLNVNVDDLEDYTVTVIDANLNETEYVQCSISGYNFTDNTITENNVVYHYKDYWFDDLNTIRVTFTADDDTILEKTIPAYKMHSTNPVEGYEYLYCFVTYKDGTNKAWIYELPVNGTETVYQYDGYDFTKKQDTTISILPAIPIKKGGYWEGFWDWNDYQLNAWRYKNGEDLTGTTVSLPSDETVKKYTDKCDKLYKKCKYLKKIDTYNTYKKCAKRMGGDIRQKMSILYDTMCGFHSEIEVTGNMRKQLYDVYDGFFCPIHAIRADACITHKADEFPTVYAELKEKYPNRPEIAQYARYTFYSNDKFFDTDT